MLIVNSAAVQAAMLNMGLGVRGLALLAQIPPKTISALHRHNKKVHLPTLSRLAKALGVAPMELVAQVQ